MTDSPDNSTSNAFDRDLWIAHAYQHHKEGDANRNALTKPPLDERVTVLSAARADVYFGDNTRQFTGRLAEIDWSDSEDNPPLVIGRALHDRVPSWGTYRIFPIGCGDRLDYLTGGFADLPDGVSEVVTSYLVLPPNLILLNTTFELIEPLDSLIHEAISVDAESRFEVKAKRIVEGSLDFAKRNAVRKAREAINTSLEEWTGDHFGRGWIAGTEQLRTPYCLLTTVQCDLSLKASPPYLQLLDFVPISSIFELTNHPEHYVVFPHAVNTPSEMWGFARARETDSTAGPLSRENLPYTFHGAISPMMMTEAVRLVLFILGNRVDDANEALESVSLEGGQDSQLPQLRKLQLDLAIKLTRFCDYVDELTGRHFLLWSEYPTLSGVEGTLGLASVPSPQNQKEALVALTRQLRSQESSLRSLVEITSAAIVDRDTINLTKDVKRLTKWILGLTAATVAVSVAAVIISLWH